MACSLVLLIASASLTLASETVLYRETFEHGPGPLAGKVPTISHSGSAWVTQYRGDKFSFFGTGRFQGNRQNAVWLPFTPKPGHKYVLEATLMMSDGPKDRGVSIGFSSMDSEQPFGQLPTYGTIVMFRNPNNVFDAFAGPGKENPVKMPTGRLTPTHVRIILDASAPTPGDWTLSIFVEELLIGENLKIPAESGSLGDIQFAGLTSVGGGGSVGEIQNFSLTEIPANQ